MPNSRSRFIIFRSTVLFAAALVVAATMCSGVASAATTTVSAQHSGKCLDVAGGPQAIGNGAVIDQWTCTGEANQAWTLIPTSGGQYQFVAQNSGKCLDVPEGIKANNVQLQQRDCVSAREQLWTLQSKPGGYYSIVSVASGKCVDVSTASTADYAQVIQFDCSGRANQLWQLAAPLTPHPVTRDPLKWPFAQNSIWNTPIGSGAVYVAANLSGKPGNDVWAPMPQIDRERIVLKPAAPLSALNFSSAGWSGANRCSVSGGAANGLPVSVPIPGDYIVPNSGGNESAAFLQPDGHTVVQTQPFARCLSGGYATSYVRFADVDLYGDGRTGAHGGSGLSALGGSIRLNELRPGSKGPQHVLKMNVYASEALYRCTTFRDCYRWPASTADGYAVGHYGAANGNPNTAMKMGALLAIPAATNIANLRLETEPARQLAWTLQNYGAYIVDDTWGPAIAFNAEDGADGSKPTEFQNDYGFPMEQRVNDNTPWSRDVQRLITALSVVNNNSPTSIGGGGTPRQPLAPPFQ